MPERKPFPCNGCAKCCRKVATAVAFAKKAGFPDEVCDFPYTWDEQGVCEMLTHDNKCKIYERRPLLCNVKEMYKYVEDYFKKMHPSHNNHNIDYDTYIEHNIQACNYLSS
jgi:Fe-S-cluster containining protein